MKVFRSFNVTPQFSKEGAHIRKPKSKNNTQYSVQKQKQKIKCINVPSSLCWIKHSRIKQTTQICSLIFISSNKYNGFRLKCFHLKVISDQFGFMLSLSFQIHWMQWIDVMHYVVLIDATQRSILLGFHIFVNCIVQNLLRTYPKLFIICSLQFSKISKTELYA